MQNSSGGDISGDAKDWFGGWPLIKFPDAAVPDRLAPVISALAVGVLIGFAIAKSLSSSALSRPKDRVEPVSPHSFSDIDVPTAP